jgi:hypothetical protein
MVLGDVEESVTTREIDEETEEEIVKVPFVLFFSIFLIVQFSRFFSISPHVVSTFRHVDVEEDD